MYSSPIPARDHPRACGAHTQSIWGPVAGWGSSPRMRGSQGHNGKCLLRLGIIPAHAGLTYFFKITKRCIRDHPRACGAHGSSIVIRYVHMGSSPRMRGSHDWRVGIWRCDGIIPAHAGLTFLVLGVMHSRRDHPRACGAHLPSRMHSEAAMGSSPRMRGSPGLELCPIMNLGIIPAHAGLTRYRRQY